MSVRIDKFENEYRVHSEIVLRTPVEKVFEFFSEAKNLEALTPKNLRFKILKGADAEIKTDTVIEYKIYLFGIPMTWVTLISAFKKGEFFVDEQLKGPYRYWIHRHEFVANEDGSTTCKDLVRYQPYGGAITQNLFVRCTLLKIFNFRIQTMKELFENNL